MKQYTLLYIDNPDKIVKMATFLNIEQLRDWKNYTINSSKAELIQVDKDGYIWFFENKNAFNQEKESE